MVLEVAVLQIKPGQTAAFEDAFRDAHEIIKSMPGYVSHQVQRCVENPGQYILLVNWRSLKDHTEGFRGSVQYQEWKSKLHHFYDPFPRVEHYELVSGLHSTDWPNID
jgi:heme-degrading monooxygenase HmoA